MHKFELSPNWRQLKSGGTFSMTESGRIKQLIADGEGLTIEFKEHFTSRIAEDMVAFANTRGGTIILGVRDDGAVVGEKLSNGLKAQVLSVARNCAPSIDVSVKQADTVIAVAVSEGREKPYSCSAGYFRRLDAVTQKMSNHELRHMFQASGGVPFEERICPAATLNDLSKKKVRGFMKNAGISGRALSVEGFLRSIKLAKPEGITNGAVLLFGAEPWHFLHQCELTCIRFSDPEGVDIFDRIDSKDDLITQFDTAMFFMKKHLNRRSIIQGTYRREAYDVPEEAFREAIANAVLHRDYSVQGTSLMVKVFDDRVEIVNPGGLPDGLKSADFGRVSIRRNELLCDVFHRLEIVEKAGTGIKRMRDAMKSENLPAPKIGADNFFFITLKRLQIGPSTAGEVGQGKTIQKTILKTTQKTTLKILDLMRQNPTITRIEMANAINLTLEGIKWHIAKLKAQGRIRRIGPDKGGHWEVLE
jgi:ATP-dependent DNA helicase RecG